MRRMCLWNCLLFLYWWIHLFVKQLNGFRRPFRNLRGLWISLCNLWKHSSALSILYRKLFALRMEMHFRFEHPIWNRSGWSRRQTGLCQQWKVFHQQLENPWNYRSGGLGKYQLEENRWRVYYSWGVSIISPCNLWRMLRIRVFGQRLGSRWDFRRIPNFSFFYYSQWPELS